MATVTPLVNNKSTNLVLVKADLTDDVIATIFPADVSNGSYTLKSIYLQATPLGTVTLYNSVDNSLPSIIFNTTALTLLNLTNLSIPFTQGSAIAIKSSVASMGTAYLVFERKD